MTAHSALTGAELHVCKGVSPTALDDIPDNTANAMRWQQSTNDYLVIDTTDASEAFKVGNTTTNPKFTIRGTGDFTFGGSLKHSSKSLTVSATGASSDYFVRVDTTTVAVTYTLQAPATFGTDRTVWFKDVAGKFNTNNFTLSRANGGNIDGSANNKVFIDNYAAFGIYCDGTNFFII